MRGGAMGWRGGCYLPAACACPLEHSERGSTMADSVLEQIRGMVQDPFLVTTEEVCKVQAATGLTVEDLVVVLLQLLSEYAVPPISNFRATAVGVGQSGNIYGGVNVEFLGAPLFNSIHAEQCMIANMKQAGEEAIASATTAPAPCGHCRQFFRECRGSDSMSLNIVNKADYSFAAKSSLVEVLPHSFSPLDLGCSQQLLDTHEFKIELLEEWSGCKRLRDLGLKHAARSYSPHTRSPSSVVLEVMRSDEVVLFAGEHLENAAHNPSLPPLQCAVARMVRGGVSDWSQVRRVVLFEQRGHVVSMEQWTAAIVKTSFPHAHFDVHHFRVAT